MKDNFRELISQIDEIEKLFHSIPPTPGFSVVAIEEIYDVQEFQLWLQAVRLEVQSIVDRTNDSFAIDTLKTLSSPSNGWNDRKNFNDIKAKLKAMAGNIEKYYLTDPAVIDKPPKIFISHSSRDKDYVAKIVALLDDMGLDQTQIFCSSLPGYDVPIDMDIFDYLRNQFRQFNLHMVIVHSDNYYQSPVSLNEMGAAWVLRSNCTSFLLPGFGFDSMRGVVNQNAIAIKLDNDITEVKDKLNQFYDIIIDEFALTKKASIIWEQKRDAFIRDVGLITPTSSPPEDDKTADLETTSKGYLVKKSEVAEGKQIAYCPACYQNYGKLYPVVPGSMKRDLFCSNCKTHYTR